MIDLQEEMMEENGRTEEERRNDFKLFWEEKGERK
jgi:hypothetical protein